VAEWRGDYQPVWRFFPCLNSIMDHPRSADISNDALRTALPCEITRPYSVASAIR
jgi:hypothetical protein